MSIRHLNQRMRRENRLNSALIELTYRCNLDCFFCYNDLSLEGRALTLEQHLALLDDLAEMGVMTVALTGGEPLSHPEFFAIGQHARKRNFMVRIKTNGHAMNESVARRVREEIDPYVIETSVHGAAAATHDRQTRVPGSFERLIGHIEAWRAIGLVVKINTTLTRWNEREIDGVFELADRLGCELQVDPEVTPRDDGSTEPLQVTASAEGVRRLFELYLEREQRLAAARVPARSGVTVGRQDADLMKQPAQSDAGDRPKHCGAGSVGVAIDPFGNVFPCVQWRRSIGTLHERRIHEIWADRAVLGEIRRATEDVTEVIAAHGEQGARMGFCPGLAHTKTGNPLQIYPGAFRRAEAIGAAYGETEVDEQGRNAARQRLPVIA